MAGVSDLCAFSCEVSEWDRLQICNMKPGAARGGACSFTWLQTGLPLCCRLTFPMATG